MTKKVFILVISVWIVSNFGCTGLQTPNTDTNNIIDTCKVTYVTGSVDIEPREKGDLIITNNNIQFCTSNRTIEIPLASITHIGPTDSMILDLPTPLSLNYAENCPDERKGLPSWLLVTGVVLLIAGVLWITGVFSHNKVLMDMDFMINGVKNFTTLKMTRDEFSRIYPILLEKANLI